MRPPKSSANISQYQDLLIRPDDPYANAKYEIILDYLKKKSVKTVLNAGCGSGELSLILAQSGYDVTGIDAEGKYIALARQNAKKINAKNCHFVVSKIEKYKPNHQFDSVIATDVLEHIANDRKAFKSLAQLTKEDGLTIITVPAGQYLFGLHDKRLGHFRRYSRNSLENIVPKELKVNQIRYFGFLLIPAAFLLSHLLQVSYPITQSGQATKNPRLVRLASRFGFFIEKKVRFPLGTSLLLFAVKSNHRPYNR